MLSLGAICRRVPDLKMLLYREIHRNYYDALGLTPKASQGDIKQAYYRMSMVYHPDKGAENSAKFQEISTAYEVLGNSKLRKLYDKGLLPAGAAKLSEVQEQQRAARSTEHTASRTGPSQNKSQNDGKFYENVNAKHFEDRQRKRATHTGKSQHYDYDAWTQAHYSDTFAKQEYRKAAAKDRQTRMRIEKLKRLDAMVTSFFFVSIVMVLYCASGILNHDYQQPVYYKTKDK